MKQKISRILIKHIRRLRIYYLSIILIFFFTLIFFFSSIRERDKFINEFSTQKTEWSQTEFSSFLSRIIAEFKKVSNNGENSDKVNKDIKKILLDVKKEIEDIGVKQGDEEGVKDSVNIDCLNYDEVPKYLDENRLKYLLLEHLNLKLEKKTLDEWKDNENTGNSNIKNYILRNKEERCIPKSFVFVPTQLVNVENNQPILSISLKRDLVFSKIVEQHLLRILDALKDISGANQSYFIPLSGFVRLCRKESDPEEESTTAVEYYKDKLSFKRNYADRSYFDITIRDRLHITPLYVDPGGFGIVRTYCISILNHELGIVGIIGVDVTEIEIGTIIEKITPGTITGLFKNYSIDFCDPKKISSPGFKTDRGILKNDDKSYIYSIKSKNKENMVTQVNRFDFDINGNPIKTNSLGDDFESSKKLKRIIYSVPVSSNKVAFFIFDEKIVLWNNIYFALFLVFLMIVFSVLIKFIFGQMKKRIHEEEKKLELITHMHSSYVITDKFNRIQANNEEFENLVKENKTTGENFKCYLTEDSMKDLNFFIESGKDRFECPVVIKTKSGSEKSAILINSRISYHLDNKARISILIESENLESLVAEKYADRISHILKSPLHSILQIADQLRRKTAKPRYDDYFRILDVEIAGLKGEIARSLSMMKTEYKQPRPEYKKFDITKLVKSVKGEYIPLIEKKKLGFNSNFDEEAVIVADRNMIKVTIENLLDNALKYTPHGSISFYLYDSVENIEIVITDTGVGIPENEIGLIFRKNFRGENPFVREAPGKGIGLYHCWNFIKLHMGNISVKSVVNKGTEFTILLPKNLKESKGE